MTSVTSFRPVWTEVRGGTRYVHEEHYPYPVRGPLVTLRVHPRRCRRDVGTMIYILPTIGTYDGIHPSTRSRDVVGRQNHNVSVTLNRNPVHFYVPTERRPPSPFTLTTGTEEGTGTVVPSYIRRSPTRKFYHDTTSSSPEYPNTLGHTRERDLVSKEC